jgi:hypothetical protein
MTDDITPSPLSEAQPESLDLLFERINEKLVAGLPEAITDADMLPVVNALRADRLRFIQAQDKLGRAPPAPRKTKPKGVADAIATMVSAEDL